MNIFGSLVVKNEADRYLYDCVSWNSQFLDGLFVFDDQSTDDTVAICESLGAKVAVREDTVSSFLEHESNFRFAAWGEMEEAVNPGEGDWILSFDADEFLVSDFEDIRASLVRAIQLAEQDGSLGIILKFHEIFGIEDSVFMERIDGFWGKVKGPRLFKYLPGRAAWSGKPMGSGSEPLYVTQGKSSSQSFGLSFLHLGYAKMEDKIAKYERYTSLYDHGHNDKHIQSIIRKPNLAPVNMTSSKAILMKHESWSLE